MDCQVECPGANKQSSRDGPGRTPVLSFVVQCFSPLGSFLLSLVLSFVFQDYGAKQLSMGLQQQEKGSGLAFVYHVSCSDYSLCFASCSG